MRRTHLWRVVGLLGVMGIAGAAPAVGATPRVTSTAGKPTTGVFLASEPGVELQTAPPPEVPEDYLGTGHDYSYSDVTYVTRGPGQSPEFRVMSNGDIVFDIQFAPPDGQALSPGDYENAESYTQRSASSPGIDAELGSHGCGYYAGRFVVTEAAYDHNLNPVSFSAQFEIHCQGQTQALFGVLDYNSTTPLPNRSLSSSFMNFYSKHNRPQSHPITVTNTGTASLHPSYAIVGPQAGNFRVRRTSCGATLAPGASCHWIVTFKPGSPIESDATFEYFDELSRQGSPGEAFGAGTGWHIYMEGINTDPRAIPCQFNGQSGTTATGVVPGGTVVVACTGLRPYDQVDMMEASPLFNKTHSGNDQDINSFQTVTADASGTLNATFAVPDSFSAADSAAVCPPSPAQVAAGDGDCMIQLSNGFGDNATGQLQYSTAS